MRFGLTVWGLVVNMKCAKCGDQNSISVTIYPYGYKHKKANRINLCTSCKSKLRLTQGKLRNIRNLAESDVLCLCCEPGLSEFSQIIKDLEDFFAGIILSDGQRKYT